MITRLALVCITLLSISSFALGEERVLFNFEGSTAANAWQAVNDGVMGGRSVGRFKITKD